MHRLDPGRGVGGLLAGGRARTVRATQLLYFTERPGELLVGRLLVGRVSM